ncbi:hypothetical protein F2981_23360 (plasmid) [Sinorhizobium meliloti]|nr:hypothetical protein [Sinorhizobium meliloti]
MMRRRPSKQAWAGAVQGKTIGTWNRRIRAIDHLEKFSYFSAGEEYRLKTAWGTDILSNPTMTKHQGAILATMSRWYSNDEILTMATSSNAACWRCPARAILIPVGSVVIEADAYADTSSSTATRLADIKLIADPDANLKLS